MLPFYRCWRRMFMQAVKKVTILESFHGVMGDWRYAIDRLPDGDFVIMRQNVSTGVVELRFDDEYEPDC